MEGEPPLRPMDTLMSDLASARESLRFCACAGAWEPHPITPIDLTPSKALGRRWNLSLPPRKMVSVVSANWTCSVLNTLELNAERDVVEEDARVAVDRAGAALEGMKATGAAMKALEDATMRAAVTANTENFIDVFWVDFCVGRRC
jgi:hypothetical protein